MCIRRDLLEEMAFARTARTKFDEIVVPLHERNHAKESDALRCLVETGWLQTYRPQKKINPFGGRELRATLENTSSTSERDIWMGRNADTLNGSPAFSWAMDPS